MTRWRRTRGVAAVEFVICVPFLMALLAGLSDLGLALRSKAHLANGVANATNYAFLAQGAATPATLVAIVKSASTLTGVSASATASACFCPGGSPVKLTAATCGTNCADGTPAGTYVTVSGSYTYTPLMPGYAFVASTSFTEATTVRVK
jgi:Flp pilus assembly protein TadG